MTEIPICNFTTVYEDLEAGGEQHVGMVAGILDRRIALVYPGYLDFHIFKWFKQKQFRIIEVPKDEYHKYHPTCFTILEPGKIIMDAAAKETIKRVREAGIEVIELDCSGLRLGANGIKCFVMRLVSDEGPRLED